MTSSDRLRLLKRLMAQPVSDGARVFLYWYFQSLNSDDHVPIAWDCNATFATAMGKADPGTIGRYVAEWVRLGVLIPKTMSRAQLIKRVGERGRCSRPQQNRVLLLNTKVAWELPANNKWVGPETTGKAAGSSDTHRKAAGSTPSELAGRPTAKLPTEHMNSTNGLGTHEGSSVTTSSLPPPATASPPQPASRAEEATLPVWQREFPGERPAAKVPQLLVGWGFDEELIPMLWRSDIGESAGVFRGCVCPPSLQPELWAAACKFVGDRQQHEQREKVRREERCRHEHRQAALGWLAGGDSFRLPRLQQLHTSVLTWLEAGGEGEPPLKDSDWAYVLPKVKL